MSFYNLNIPWIPGDKALRDKLEFLDELGYRVIALSHTITGKIPADLTSPISVDASLEKSCKARILRRCTVVTSDPSQNYRLPSLVGAYDLVAVRPTTEKAFQQAYSGPEHISIISFDFTQRLPFHFRPKTVAAAVAKGIRFEICYAPGIMARDNMARRNLISNATQLIRASSGKGIIFSSEAQNVLGIRAPIDVTNLATVWGLSQEQGRNAICGEAKAVVSRADFLRSSYRGIIDVISSGIAEPVTFGEVQPRTEPALKRKAEAEMDVLTGSDQGSQISKREQKRRAKQGRRTAAAL
ncbi:MAG: hypothetical protein M1814_002029 [Vezdaea aestivalis]|nr:MAG: hypothetical protein M1814_002029 [Vezdaea aestivalis]